MDLVIAEFPIENTSLAGRTIRDTRLRELTGLSIVAVSEQGHLVAAGPDTLLSPHSVPVVVGTEEQITDLDGLFIIYHSNENPVRVIGGGKGGGAAARELRQRGVRVTIIDKNPALAEELTLNGSLTGVIVIAVAGGSAAGRIDIRPGDKVIRVNRSAVTSVGGLTKIMRRHPERWNITVRRGSQVLPIVIGG